MRKESLLEIQEYIEKHGSMKASDCVRVAKRKSTSLHREFIWDDAKAAHEQRLETARRLLKRAFVIIDGEKDPVVHVPAVRMGEGEYKPLSVVVQSQSEYERSLSEALSKLRAAERLVQLLEQSAETDDLTALSIALKAMSTAESALKSVMVH